MAGVIALSGPGARKKAEKLMAEHFPGGYEIVRKEEVVVGQRVDYHEETEPRGRPPRRRRRAWTCTWIMGERTRGTETGHRPRPSIASTTVASPPP